MKSRDQKEWERGDNPSTHEVKEEVFLELYGSQYYEDQKYTICLCKEIRAQMDEGEWDDLPL